MGKPVPAVPDRILALKTPAFPAAYADPLVADAKLQAALDAAIASGPGAAWRVPVAIVALNADGKRPMASFRGDEVHYSASLVKVAAMYSAFELRSTLQKIAGELGAKTSPKELLADAARYLDPQIVAKAGTIAAFKGLQKIHAVPKYSSAFAVGPAPDLKVSFTPGFANHVQEMIRVSNNGSAAESIHGSGYGYLNGALASAGFLDTGTTNGIWLAGDYNSNYPYFRIDSVNDQLVAQAATVRKMVRMFTLIHDGKLVDAAASNEMLALLAMSAAVPGEVWINQAANINFKSTHNKIGLGPLKPKNNNGVDVYSEGSILNHTASGREFAVVWQNLIWDPNGFDDIASVLRHTIDDYLKP
jgi:hypothetical protein